VNLAQITSITADSGDQNIDQQRISCLAWPHLPTLSSDALVLRPEKEKKENRMKIQYVYCILLILKYYTHYQIAEYIVTGATR
jgi:hypothetical protein